MERNTYVFWYIEGNELKHKSTRARKPKAEALEQAVRVVECRPNGQVLLLKDRGSIAVALHAHPIDLERSA